MEKFKELIAADSDIETAVDAHGCLRYAPELHCRLVHSANQFNRSLIHVLVFCRDIINDDELEHFFATMPRETINSRDKLGRTPLFYAIMNLKLDFAFLLSKFGADSKLADNDSITPEDLVDSA
jgi:ankyrin repeat protein